MSRLAFLLLTVFLFNSFLAEGQESTIPNDNLRIGKPINGEKNLRFNRAGPKVGLRWSETNSRMEFTNDGTNYKALGSGGGGSGGVNLLQEANFDFESGTNGWINSGGAFLIETTSPLNGDGSGKFNASASAQTLASDSFIVLPGFEGRKCQVHIPYYKYEAGADGDYVLKVLNGEDVEIVAGINFNVTGAAATSTIFQTFDCPALNGGDDSDLIRVVIESTADGGDLIVDDIFLGQGRNEVFWAGSTVFGTSEYQGTASCLWLSTSASIASFAAVAACPVATTTGGLSPPATKIPGFSAAYMPAGKYKVSVNGSIAALESSSAAQTCIFELYDGVSRAGRIHVEQDQSKGTQLVSSITGVFEYATPQTNKTFEIRSYRTGGNSNCAVLSHGTDRYLTFLVEYIPDSAVQGATYDTTGWRVDASISGANPDLGTSSVGTYTGITNGSLTLANSTGRGVIAAQIPCSSTNPPTGTTCAAGDESLGVSFVAPKAQDVRVCASYSLADNCATGTGMCSTGYTFKIAQTGNSDQTIGASGGENVAAGGSLQQNSGSGVQIRSNMKVCGRFSLTNAGLKTFRLMRVQDASSNISSSFVFADAGLGSRDVRFTVEPINESMPTPVFDELTASLNSKVTSFPTTVLRYGNVNCSASSSINRNNGSWISSIGNISGGACTVNLAGGVFTQAPDCFAQDALTAASPQIVGALGSTATAVLLDGATDNGTASTNYTVELLCVGI